MSACKVFIYRLTQAEIMQPVLADEGRHSNTVQKLDVL